VPCRIGLPEESLTSDTIEFLNRFPHRLRVRNLLPAHYSKPSAGELRRRVTARVSRSERSSPLGLWIGGRCQADTPGPTFARHREDLLSDNLAEVGNVVRVASRGPQVRPAHLGDAAADAGLDTRGERVLMAS
jgi:hypothetical protein